VDEDEGKFGREKVNGQCRNDTFHHLNQGWAEEPGRQMDV
jgi:hypothetical protein